MRLGKVLAVQQIVKVGRVRLLSGRADSRSLPPCREAACDRRRTRWKWPHDRTCRLRRPARGFIPVPLAFCRAVGWRHRKPEMKWLNGFSLAATFEGEFSDVTRSYAGKGVARLQ